MYDKDRTRTWARCINRMLEVYACNMDGAPQSVAKPYRAMVECSKAFLTAAESGEVET